MAHVIPIKKILANPVVDRTSKEYLDLVEDIRRNGFMYPIDVIEYTKGNEVYYTIIDGMHRFYAAIDAGLTVILVSIQERKML